MRGKRRCKNEEVRKKTVFTAEQNNETLSAVRVSHKF